MPGKTAATDLPPRTTTTTLQARNDGGKQLGRGSRVAMDFVFMLPGIILLLVAMFSMFSQNIWLGPIVTAAITGILLLLVGVWKLGTTLERASGPSTVGRFVKFIVNAILFGGAVALLVAIFQIAKVSLHTTKSKA